MIDAATFGSWIELQPRAPMEEPGASPSRRRLLAESSLGLCLHSRGRRSLAARGDTGRMAIRPVSVHCGRPVRYRQQTKLLPLQPEQCKQRVLQQSSQWAEWHNVLRPSRSLRSHKLLFPCMESHAEQRVRLAAGESPALRFPPLGNIAAAPHRYATAANCCKGTRCWGVSVL